MMFTEIEINILMEAMDAWEQEEVQSSLMMGMLGMAIGGSENYEETKTKLAEDMENAVAITKMRKEQAVLLKAKLLGMRDKIVAANAGEFLESGK